MRINTNTLYLAEFNETTITSNGWLDLTFKIKNSESVKFLQGFYNEHIRETWYSDIALKIDEPTDV